MVLALRAVLVLCIVGVYVGLILLGLLLALRPDRFKDWMLAYRKRNPPPNWLEPVPLVDDEWLESRTYIVSLRASGIGFLLLCSLIAFALLRSLGILKL